MSKEAFGNVDRQIEEVVQHRPLEELAIELAELDPRPVTNFTPDNLGEVLNDSLSGKRRNPDNATYSKLDVIDFDDKEAQYKILHAEVLAHPEVPKKHQHVYISFVDRAIKVNELMRQAVLFRTSETARDKERAEEQFMVLNRELYGEPNPGVAASMIAEVFEDTKGSDDPQIVRIRQEFIDLLPSNLVSTSEAPAKLKPSKETQEYTARIVEFVYGSLLKHADRCIEIAKTDEIPEEELRFGPQEIAELFQTIIDEEFPDSGWKVEVCEANAIYADPTTKTVKVPENRKPVGANKLRGLVVHELGIHMLRSIMGEKADLIPLRYGLAGSVDSEEGLATMLESVMTGNPERTGYQHYLTATLITEGYDFRDAFEVMWRYKVLDAYLDKDKKVEVDEEYIASKKTTTAKFMFRSIRGTNSLPWYTTLNYRNGAAKMWEYIETHMDAPELLFLLFAGKIDPTNPNHVRGAFDALSRVEV